MYCFHDLARVTSNTFISVWTSLKNFTESLFLPSHSREASAASNLALEARNSGDSGMNQTQRMKMRPILTPVRDKSLQSTQTPTMQVQRTPIWVKSGGTTPNIPLLSRLDTSTKQTGVTDSVSPRPIPPQNLPSIINQGNEDRPMSRKPANKILDFQHFQLQSNSRVCIVHLSFCHRQMTSNINKCHHQVTSGYVDLMKGFNLSSRLLGVQDLFNRLFIFCLLRNDFFRYLVTYDVCK